jgi:hypothetical protein
MTKVKRKMVKKPQTFRSVIDIEREYLPNLFAKREKNDDNVHLANLAIKNVKKEIEAIHEACAI